MSIKFREGKEIIFYIWKIFAIIRPREKDLSTIQEKEKIEARFSSAEAFAGREKNSQPTAEKRSSTINSCVTSMTQFCIRWDQRIRKPRHFETIIGKGVFARGQYLNVWAHNGKDIRTDTGAPMFAVMVGKKTDAKATRRNLWKRKIREIFRRHQGQMKNNIAVVFQSKASKKLPTKQKLERDILNLLQRTHCWEKDEPRMRTAGCQGGAL